MGLHPLVQQHMVNCACSFCTPPWLFKLLLTLKFLNEETFPLPTSGQAETPPFGGSSHVCSPGKEFPVSCTLPALPVFARLALAAAPAGSTGPSPSLPPRARLSQRGLNLCQHGKGGMSSESGAAGVALQLLLPWLQDQNVLVALQGARKTRIWA